MMLTSAKWQEAAPCSYNLFCVHLSPWFSLMNYDQPKHTALQLDIAAICCPSKGHSSTTVPGTARENGWICGPGEDKSILSTKASSLNHRPIQPSTLLPEGILWQQPSPRRENRFLSSGPGDTFWKENSSGMPLKACL